jgi:N-acetylmuramoyl-L-alanine amidase
LNRSHFAPGLNSLRAAGRGLSGGKFTAALVCVLASAVCAQAGAHHSQAWAETQFKKAEGQHDTLNRRAEQARTRHEYETVIASYRSVYFEAPNSIKAEGSVFEVAELTAEMGRRFKDEMALYAAIRHYKFLRREYPGSKHRVEALLAIGKIYKNDLGDESDARAAFKQLIRHYPRSDSAKEAQAELAATGEEAKKSAVTSDEGATAATEKTATAQDRDRSGQTDQSPAAASAATDDPVRVKNVEYQSTTDYTRVTVDLEQGVQFDARRLVHPDRIFFDLKNARVGSPLRSQSFDVNDGLVKRVRIAQFKPGRARLVIDTKGHASYEATLEPNPTRLVVDVRRDDTHTARADSAAASARDVSATKSDADSDSETKLVTAVERSSAPPDAANAQSPSTGPKKVIVEADDDHASANPVSNGRHTSRGAARNAKGASAKEVASARNLREAQPTSDGDRSLIRTLGLRIGKIVIDPGHGGHDTGTIGPHGLLEKDLVLDVSKRLARLLERRLGAEVVLTRHDDTFVPLETRTAIANQEQADLFVSIHANSSHDPDARGVETYYLNFTSSPEALEVAARENAASDKSIHELQDLVKKIALKEKIEESREFATDVQESLHAGLAVRNPGERDRGVKKAPFIVLIGANMPSILTEISFVSNPHDERRLRTAAYRQRIAESIYRGIAHYVNGLGGVSVASKLDKASGN